MKEYDKVIIKLNSIENALYGASIVIFGLLGFIIGMIV